MNVAYTTIQTFLDSILGTYTPITWTDAQGVTSALSGIAAVDFPYLIRACVFLLTIYCVYKVIGGLICKIY